jgi:type IV secretion system protein VirB10
MIDGVIQSAVNRSQQNGGTVILNPSGAGDVATEVLRSTLNIPPTVRIPQGERIEVLVARDLDFRGVYSLHTR